MSRKIKGSSLAAIAIAGMGLAAAVAQATQIHATNPGQHSQVVIHGEQKAGNPLMFLTNAGSVQCTQATLEGTAAPTADELTITPQFTGCQAFGQAQTMDINGCKFTLTGTQAAAQTWGTKTAAVDIAGCTSSKRIEITTAICRMTVPEQSNLQHISVENTVSGTHHDVTGQITASGITYQADGPLCPTMPSGQTLANGTMSGKVTIQAYTSLGTALVTHIGHQYSRHVRAATPLGLQIT